MAQPAKLSVLKNTLFCTAGAAHSLTVDNHFNLFSFGENKYGELGNGEAGVQVGGWPLHRIRSVCQW